MRFKISKLVGVVVVAVVLGVLALLCPLPAVANLLPAVVIQGATVGSGQTVEVPININNVTDLGTATIWLCYDEAVVTVDNVTGGDVGTVIYAIYNDQGVTKMTWYKAEGVSGNYTFANVTLHADTIGTDWNSVLDLDVKEFVATDFTPIVPEVIDAAFNIDALPPTCTVSVGTPVVCDGGPVQEVTVNYNEAMLATPAPTISFATTAGTWTSQAGAWDGTGTIWTENFIITDANEEVASVDVSVSGARDAVGNIQIAYTEADAFAVDTKNPVVVIISPVNGATAVTADAAVSANFSENIQPGANFTAITIFPDPGSVYVMTYGNVLSITHADFTYQTTYTVNITAGAVSDFANNANVGYSWSFTPLMEGDVTGDGYASGADCLLIAQYVVGVVPTLSQGQLTCADTTDEEQVTTMDAMHIAQWVVDPTGTGVLKKALWEELTDSGITVPPEGIM